MSKPNVVESNKGTEITWKAGCDPTHMKKTKKKKGKKVTTNEKVPSFFDLFSTIDVAKNAAEDSDDNEEAEKMDMNMELANEIKDSVIPLALELYLGVIELGEDSEDDGEDDDDDSDDEAPKGKPLKGKDAAAAPKGKDGKDCKQQ